MADAVWRQFVRIERIKEAQESRTPDGTVVASDWTIRGREGSTWSRHEGRRTRGLPSVGSQGPLSDEEIHSRNQREIRQREQAKEIVQ